MKTYDRGTSVFISAITRNVSGVLADPTSIVISITDPGGSAKVSGAAMVKSVVGKYFYVWQSSDSDSLGTYTVAITVVSEGYTSITKGPLFILE